MLPPGKDQISMFLIGFMFILGLYSLLMFQLLLAQCIFFMLLFFLLQVQDFFA